VTTDAICFKLHSPHPKLFSASTRRHASDHSSLGMSVVGSQICSHSLDGANGSLTVATFSRETPANRNSAAGQIYPNEQSDCPSRSSRKPSKDDPGFLAKGETILSFVIFAAPSTTMIVCCGGSPKLHADMNADMIHGVGEIGKPVDRRRARVEQNSFWA
jgi:hypothetical protein